MLDTRLSDALKYPLRVSDLIVTDVATDSAPEKLVWASDKQNIVEELPNVAMSGDHFHRPAFVSDNYVEYSGTVMSIDPSGRGKDETGYAVVKFLMDTNLSDAVVALLVDTQKKHLISWLR